MRRKVDLRSLERILDANVNRAKEGLRVCEDTVRFVYNDRSLTSRFKNVRHELTDTAAALGPDALIRARDVSVDTGRPTSVSESARSGVPDVFRANVQRVKESLRVLEEFAKIIDGKVAERFKNLRYRVYELEKKTLERL